MKSVQKRQLGLAMMAVAAVIFTVFVICALMVLGEAIFVHNPFAGLVVILTVTTAGCGYGGWYLYAENQNSDLER